MKHDVVYILKNGIDPEELRYSLRSVEKNFPHKRIWFAGGQPEGFNPDAAMPIQQHGINKWEKVRNTLIEICKNNDITEDFWLFNDDFFVMKKITKEPEPMIAGSIAHRVQRIEKRHGGPTNYTRQLRQTETALKIKGYDCLDYALHVPMLINRAKALETLHAFPGCPMFRSLYGNQHSIGGAVTRDVKAIRLEDKPKTDAVFLSTSDKTFKGKTGEYIRGRFKTPGRCEKTGGIQDEPGQ